MPAPFHGSCLCGEVNFEVTSNPVLVTCCHCGNCKKYTGTVFTTNVVFPADSIEITKGKSLVHTFEDAVQDTGNTLLRSSCRKCASPLYSATIQAGGHNGPTVAVYYSALDDFDRTEDGKEKPPQVEYYAKDRVAWVSPVPGAQEARTKPGRDD